MKNYLLLLFLIALTISCYSPKSDIEEDKHPEMPEFPLVQNQKIKIEKVADWYEENNFNIRFLAKNNKLIIFYTPKIIESENQYSKLFVIEHAKRLLSDSLKMSFDNLNTIFLDNQQNLIVNKYKYQFPDYQTKSELAFYDLKDIKKKYESQLHIGEQERDSAVFDKIYLEQKDLQEKVINRIKYMYKIRDWDSFASTEVSQYPYMNYYCNLDDQDAFLINDDFLNNISTNYTHYKPNDQNLERQLESKVKNIPPENLFNDESSQLQSTLKTQFKKASDSVVSGNIWYSQGNHFVASFGYLPTYLKYYNFDVNGIKAATKIDFSTTKIINIADNKVGTYIIIVKNVSKKKKKYQVYYIPK